MKLFRPLKRNLLTQGFGKKNTLPSTMPFYKELKMDGHNGWDWGATIGEKLYWNCGSLGTVIELSLDERVGLGIVIVSQDGNTYFKHIFWHLSKILCKVGDIVGSGDLIGLTGNTGQYSTGPHLHWGLKKCNNMNWTLDYQNGYKGAIDPTPYFQNIFIGDYMASLQTQLRLLKQLIKLWKDFIKLKVGR